ncbi:MAG: Glycosyl transferase family 2 [uncultured bacterium]|nr:MAG: Glycosyl transferase family 2 [uncultured bacterium]
MKISIIVPIYNEENYIKQILESLINLDLEKYSKEIIIVDDGSTDNSPKILQSYEKKPNIIIVYQSKNQGKGAAVRQGMKIATGDIICIQDADLEYDPQDIKRILPLFENNLADVVYGSRFISSPEHRVLYYWHYVGNKLITSLSNILTNLNLSDIETCRKLFRKEVIEQVLPKLKSKGFEFEAEITALISKKPWRIYEVGISYYGRTYKEGKKIKWIDALKTFVIIIRTKFIKL